MIKLAGFLLAVVATYVVALEYNWNDRFDRVLELYNEGLRKAGSTTFNLIGGRLNHEIETGPFLVVGLDSLVRTGPCTMFQEGSRASYEHHFGLRMLVAIFPSLNVQGRRMSAYARVRNNSIHFKFTVINDRRCRVALDELKVEELNQIEFGSSISQFDGSKVDQLTKNAFLNAVNAQLQNITNPFEEQLTRHICHRQVQQGSFLQIFSSILSH